MAGTLKQRFWGTTGCSLVLAVLALFVLYPVVLIVYASFLVPQPDGTERFGFDAWVTVWQRTGMLDAVINTLRRAAITEAISLPLAVVIAWLVARTDIPLKRLIDEFFWIAFFLPALPVLMGWILLFDPDTGVANQFLMRLFDLREAPFDIFTFGGIVFAHLASRSVASKYILLVPAFRNLDSSMEEAAYMVGSSVMQTIRKIVVPILMPAILIAMTISLVFALESFEVELILGPPVSFYVFSTKMYQLVRISPPEFGAATVLGLTVLAFVLPLILWQQSLVRRRSHVTLTSHHQSRLFHLRAWRWPAFGLLAALGLGITALPVVFLVMGTVMNIFGNFDLKVVWTLDHWRNVLADPVLTDALANTLLMAGSAAIFGTVWFALVAYISVRTRYAGRGVIDVVTWLPATLPGIVLSLGFLWMFLELPMFRPLYGTLFVLVVAVLVNAMTTSVQIIKGNMVQIGSELEEASYVTGASWAATFRRIVLPLLGPVLISAALLTFSSAARNVAAVVMIVSGRNRPIAMLQVDYMIDGQHERAAIIGVIIVALTLSVVWIARWVGKRAGFKTL